MHFEEQPTRSEIALTWLSRIFFILFLLMAGAAFGSIEMAGWMSDEMQARFDCVEKAK